MMTTNGKMCPFNLEKNGLFAYNHCLNPSSVNVLAISRKPVLGIALNANWAKRIQFFGVRRPNCRMICALSGKDSESHTLCGSLLQKEFEFKPAFDEYLKIMESVANGGDDGLNEKTDGRHSRTSSSGEDSLNKFQEKDGGRTSQITSSGRLAYKERDRDLGNRFLKKGGLESGRISVKDKLSRRESGKNSKDDRRVRPHQKLDGVKRDVAYVGLEREKSSYSDGVYSEFRRNGNWTKEGVKNVGRKIGGSGIAKSMKDPRGTGCHAKFNIVKSNESNEHVSKEELVSDKDSKEMRKKQLRQSGTWMKGQVDNVKRNVDEPYINRGIPKRKSFARTMEGRSNDSKDAETEMDEYKIRMHNLERMSFSSRMDGRKADSVAWIREEIETDNEENEVYADEIEINSTGQGTMKPKFYSVDPRKETSAQHRSEKYVWLHKHAARTGKVGPTNTEMNARSSGEYIQAKKNEIVVRPRSVFMEDNDGENGLQMERKAFETFEVFTDIRDRPRVLRMEMEERIKKLAKWLNGTDINLPEWQFSKMMHSAKIKFSDHTILRVVQILGALGNWKRALQVVQWLQLRDHFKSYKSKYIYTAVLDVLGKTKRPVEALNVFHSMRQQFSSYPDLAAYHCIAVTLGQAGHLKELFDVIDCMRTFPEKKFKTGMLEKWDPRLEPDIVVYNAVLNACVCRKQWEGAFWVLQELKKQHIPPSSTTYGLVMEVMFACGKYSLVHEFFRKVEKNSIPSALNYKVLVNTLWREGKTDEAVMVVEDMERRGIVGTASLYYDLARCLCSAGRCQEALQQIEKICKVATKPLVVTYTGLIQACLESSSVQDGAYIFYHMQRFCSPNIVTCNIMLKAYIEHAMFKEAKDLFQKILDGMYYTNSETNVRDRVLPDKFTFNTMLEACVAQEAWDDFERVYQQMLDHGHHFNRKHHLRMILEASKVGEGKSLNATWERLSQSGWDMPLPIIKERFCKKLQEGEVSAAISCIYGNKMGSPLTLSKKVWLDLFNSNADRFQKDTLARLVHEMRTLMIESDQPDSALQNLLFSCAEFISTHKEAASCCPLEKGWTTSNLVERSYENSRSEFI